MTHSPTSAHKKTAWIIGASSGIGAAVVQKLAADGWDITISARRADALDDVKKSCGEHAERVTPLAFDAGNPKAVKDAVKTVSKNHDGIPHLVLYAAAYYKPEGSDTFDAEWLRTSWNVNVQGYGEVLHHVLPEMQKRKSGHIAVIASVAGYRGLPRAAFYGSTKAGLIALSESLRFSLRPHGIAVQVINPGFVKTRMTDKNTFPMPGIISAEAAADHIVKGLAKPKKFEIAFPFGFVLFMKFLRLLPASLYFWLVGKANTSAEKDKSKSNETFRS